MGAPTPKVDVKSYYLVNFFLKNCMKLKELGPQRGRIPGAPLDPPMVFTSIQAKNICVIFYIAGVSVGFISCLIVVAILIALYAVKRRKERYFAVIVKRNTMLYFLRIYRI